MHRTQIYFDEPLFNELKRQANAMGVTLSAYIREVLKKDLNEKKIYEQPIDLSPFAGIWQDRDITQETLRKKAWK